MEKIVEIMIKDAIAKLAEVHSCSTEDIMVGLMTGNEKLANELTSLVGAAEAAISDVSKEADESWLELAE